MKRKNDTKTIDDSKKLLAESFDNKATEIKLQAHVNNVKNDNINVMKNQIKINLEHAKEANKVTKKHIDEIELKDEIKNTMKSINEVAQFFLIQLLKKDK